MSRHTALKLWDSALPAQLCELIISEGQIQPFEEAKLHPDHGKEYTDKIIRNTDISFWGNDHWISGLTMHYAQLANDQVWEYKLSISQGVQFGQYDIGGNYDWHKDEFDQPFGKESPEEWQGQSRKLSVSVNLSDSNDYDGGDLMFKDTYGVVIEDQVMGEKMRQQGSVIVFPSYIVHTVTPVTRGRRYSLVSWVIGPKFV